MKLFWQAALSLLLVLSLSACNEEEIIQSLKMERNGLQSQIDSLNAQIARSEALVKNVRVIRDTVRAGEGPFHLFTRLKAQVSHGEEDLGRVYAAMQDSVEFKLRVGEIFYVSVDSANRVQRFRYAPNPITVHLVSKTDTGFTYQLIEKPVVKKQSFYEGMLEENSTLNGILFKVGIPGRMVGIESGVLQCKVAFPLARPGDKFRVLLEDSYYQDSIWVSGKVIYTEFDGRNVGHHEAFRYEDEDPKSSYNAHYTEAGDALVFDGLRYPPETMWCLSDT